MAELRLCGCDNLPLFPWATQGRERIAVLRCPATTMTTLNFWTFLFPGSSNVLPGEKLQPFWESSMKAAVPERPCVHPVSLWGGGWVLDTLAWAPVIS